MTDADNPQFLRLLADTMSFYRHDISEFTAGVWWMACKPFDIEQVAAAFTRHATDPEHGHFPPKPADIIRVLQGTTADRAAIAWGKVQDAMGRVGAYQDVVFDDPVIHAVIEDLGGWPKLCRGEIKELGYLQHRFGEGYRAYAGREKVVYPRRLAGDRSPDSEYEKKGLPLPQPMMVGDRLRCLRVFDEGGDSGKNLITQAVDLVLTRLEGPKESDRG